ncbi:MAG: M20 family metallopeptidase [Chloroflexi bacterium]|nr:M20 family metallopeptidase [Chloroflexota bacterium]
MEPSLHVEIHHYLQDNLSHYIDLLRQMVAINSFTANPVGVNALGEKTAAIFAPLGFTAETIQSNNPEFGKHLVMTRSGTGTQKIGLVSHLDTVFPEQEEIDNDFHWRIEGDRIYGPGTVDIKGGTVLIYMLLDAIRIHAPEVYAATTWVVLLNASEERNGEQFGNICVDRLGDTPQACLVFEGGKVRGKDNWLVVTRKGMVTYRVTTRGRGAHAGSDHPLGANAVTQMADIIQRIGAFTDYERGLTFNVGLVHGGTVTNRVPHSAMAELEMRAFDTAVYDEGVAAMMDLQDVSTVKSGDGSFACSVEVEITRKTTPWPRNEATDRLFAVWQAAAESIGMNTVAEERGGLSDGNYFWDQIPTLDGLGASGANFHCSEQSADGSKEQEYCVRSAFVSKTVLNVTAVLKLLQS